MATQTIRVAAPLSAGSYTANVQIDGNNTNAYSGRTLTAEAISGFWTFTVTGAASGLYAYQVLNGSSSVVAYGWFYSATDATVTIPDSNSRDEALQTQRIGMPSAGSVSSDIAATQTSVNNLLTTAMTESYPNKGAAMTVAQALYVLVAHWEETAISGTTKTLRKRDGSTTAETLTLDSATAPTSVTRAT